MWNDFGPTASTLATMVVSFARRSAVTTASWKCAERLTFHPRNARSPRDAGQVGTGRRSGWEAADGEQALVIEDNVQQVGRLIARHRRQRPRFISREPSPSSTITFCSGRASAMPRPIEEARPMACSR